MYPWSMESMFAGLFKLVFRRSFLEPPPQREVKEWRVGFLPGHQDEEF